MPIEHFLNEQKTLLKLKKLYVLFLLFCIFHYYGWDIKQLSQPEQNPKILILIDDKLNKLWE